MVEPSSVKRSSFQFSVIPPLPTSKGMLNDKDKENSISETPFRGSKPAFPMRAPHSSSRKPFRNNNGGVFRSPNMIPSSRILRAAETKESLFCLSQTSTPQHVDLCKQICNGTLLDDPSAWRQALHMAREEVIHSQDSDKPIDISHLLRLHRRAKSRFSLLETPKDNELDVVKVWLSFAETQGQYVSADEARATYRFIQNQGYGLKLAAFYVSLANFERKFNPTRAEEILKSAIQKGAEPVEELQSALLSFSVSDKSMVRTPNHEKSLSEQSPSKSQKQSGSTSKRSSTEILTNKSSLIPPIPQWGSRKRKEPKEASPKRQKQEHEPASSLMDDSNMSTGTLDLSLDYISEPKPGSSGKQNGKADSRKASDVQQIGDQKEKSLKSNVVPFTSVVQRTNERKGEPKMAKESPVRSNVLSETSEKSASKSRASLSTTADINRKPESTVRKQRSSLLTKTPRLKSVGLTGGAKRLSPEESVCLDDSDDQLVQVMKSNKEPPSNQPRKVVKMDLSYMMNWDPTKRDNTNTLNTANIATKSRQPSRAPETAEIGSKTGSTIVTSSTGSIHTARSALSHEPKDKTDICTKDSEIAKVQALSPSKQSVLPDINTDFLPLVNENNILRVNDVPYLKLGIIGKGGSSKVYRALSKDCSVLAIKRVKLGNLDQKAIDGYANEIALLKKLRGNPSIIQMYESEVDLNRQSIFLVMELGEVDLNCVLQQQSLQLEKKGNEGKCSLNMNFIRLTWQQMLGAVHSIHEERVIHGDLKPANFVFVRGALKLIDFGIAKAIQSDDTTNIYRDSQIGTLNYMSPEAILDTGEGDDGACMKIGRASDIWSLGCILYQMVYGRTPFAALHLIQKLQAIVNPSHKIEFPGDADDAAVDAIKKCLKRKAEDRPPIVGKGGLLDEHYFLNNRRKV